MNRLSFATAAVLLMTSPAAIAQVDPSSDWSAPSRFVAAVSIDAAHGDPSTSTPQGEGKRGIPLNVGVGVGGEHRIVGRLWLAASWSLAQWEDGAGVTAGYLYRRLDVGVAPRVEWYRRPGRVVTTSFDLGLPIGLSQPFVAVPQRRAFSEQVDNHLGWYWGATASVTVLFRLGRAPSSSRFGFRVETGYLRHANHRRTTSTPTDAAQAPVVQETDIVDNGVPLYVGAVIGF
jgi:hypothetical protein